jgi:hypothetical protein
MDKLAKTDSNVQYIRDETDSQYNAQWKFRASENNSQVYSLSLLSILTHLSIEIYYICCVWLRCEPKVLFGSAEFVRWNLAEYLPLLLPPQVRSEVEARDAAERKQALAERDARDAAKFAKRAEVSARAEESAADVGANVASAAPAPGVAAPDDMAGNDNELAEGKANKATSKKATKKDRKKVLSASSGLSFEVDAD